MDHFELTAPDLYKQFWSFPIISPCASILQLTLSQTHTFCNIGIEANFHIIADFSLLFAPYDVSK